MSASRALNDDEVLSEMKKIVTFITQEALEKAREIKVKADEEFNIEKAKLVRHESINIEATFQRKIKQADVQKKIAQSNHINKSRLKVLQARQQHLEELFTETRSKLQQISQDRARYRGLLRDLILQGLYQLMEEHVLLNIKKSEIDLVQGAIQDATNMYTNATRLPAKVEIEKNNWLPEDSSGGVILSSHFGRIRINNTLEERLSLAQEEMLPEIRVLLFGHPPNRKFFN